MFLLLASFSERISFFYVHLQPAISLEMQGTTSARLFFLSCINTLSRLLTWVRSSRINIIAGIVLNWMKIHSPKSVHVEEVIIALIRGFIANLYLLSCHSRTTNNVPNTISSRRRVHLRMLSRIDMNIFWYNLSLGLKFQLSKMEILMTISTDTLFIYLPANGVAAYGKSYFWKRWYLNSVIGNMRRSMLQIAAQKSTSSECRNQK